MARALLRRIARRIKGAVAQISQKFTVKKLVCASNIDWNFTWQRAQSFMSNLAKSGYEICFLNNTGFAKPRIRDLKRVFERVSKTRFQNPVPPNISVYTPTIFPTALPLSQTLNERFFFPKVMKELDRRGFSKPDVLYTLIPTPFSVALIEKLQPKRVIYDYVGDYFSHPRKPANLQEVHQKILKHSDVVITDSEKLKKYLSADHENVHILHHGVPDSFFQIKIEEHRAEPVAIKRLIYFGTIDREILDFDLIQLLADNGYSVVLAGVFKGTRLPLGGNITYKGLLNEKALIEEIDQSDAIIFPYRETELNKSVVPAKLYQSLASGKPIFTKGLPLLEELEFSDLLHISTDNMEFLNKIKEANINKVGDNEMALKRRDVALKNLESGYFSTFLNLI